MVQPYQVNTPQDDSMRYYSLARFALLAALELLNLPRNARVLVPAFICRDLLAAIHAAHATPVFYAVDESLSPAEINQNWPRASVVIAVNYFGFPQDLTEFRSYCENTGAYLIEDNAHGFLSSDDQGVPLGVRGDLGLLSIRKTLLLPNGAALLINNKELLRFVPQQEHFLHHKLSLSFRVKLVLSWLQRRCDLPVLMWIQVVVRLLRYMRTGYAITPLAPENEFQLPEGKQPHQYLLRAISEADSELEMSRRRNLYQRFEYELSMYGVRSVFKCLPLHTVPYGYAFYASKQNATRVARLARSAGFDCVRWPDLPETVKPMAPDHYHSLWMINFLC
jgi:hypothetical protein